MTQSQVFILFLFGGLILTLAQRFPGFALKRPVALLMSLVTLGLGGVAAFIYLPVELMPNNSFGVITITTPVRGGMAPSEVERQITKPIEEAVASVSYLRNMISNSTNGKSVVSLEFEPGTDMDFATLDVREKFSRIKGDLPREIESPIIAHYRESDVPVHIFALTSTQKSPEELRALVDKELKEKLMRVKGVANVDVAGGRERKIIIDVDRNRLAAQGMDIRRLVGELEKSNLNVKTGEVGSSSQESSIRAIGQFLNVDEIANTIIGLTKHGTSLYVKDVAVVRDSYLEQESLARLNSSSAVTVYIQKEASGNTVQIVKNTSKVLETFKKTLPTDISTVEISNQGKAIMAAIGSVRESLVIGIFLIFLILGLFLGLKPALIVAISIPMATLITGAIMYLEKLTVNVMTLSGLALGIGLLVDNSIVVLEIIVRSLAHDVAESEKKETIRAATNSVTGAIIGGTLASIVVFVPFFVLSKQLQILYSGMAITITIALLSSLYVAFTTVPYLISRFGVIARNEVTKQSLLQENGSPSSEIATSLDDTPRNDTVVSRLLERLQEFYARTLPRAFELRKKVLLGALLLCVGAIYVFQFHIEKNFSSGEESNEIVVFVELPSGKRLDISDRIVKEVEQKIRAYEPIASSIKAVTTRIDGWSSKVYVALAEPEHRKFSGEKVIEMLRPILKDIGKQDDAFVYFSSAKSGQELTVNVYGEDEKTTADYAMQLAALMDEKSGFTDTKIRYRPGRPEVNIMIDPVRASLFGLDPTEVGNVLHAQTRGLRATYFRQGGEEVETIVRLQVDQRDSIDSLKTLLIPTPRGGQIPLAQVATFNYSLASSEIWRNNKQRMVQVSSNITKMSLEKAAEKAKKIIAQIPFNTDYSAEIGGDYADRVKAQEDFRNAALLTCLLIFAVLACLFESLLQPLLLFVSVPLSVIGIVLALLITHTPVTMGAMIGILMTGGIVVNHAILYIDHFNAHRSKESRGNLDQLKKDLVEAGKARLRPILMTKLTTVLGLLPMALDHGNGAELWRPMAITTIGGILSSMVLTLYVLPTLIYVVEGVIARSVVRDEAISDFFEKPVIDFEPKQRLPRRSAPRNDTVKKPISVLLLLLCLFATFTIRASETLPPWVDQLVDRRVNDLLSEANRLEMKKDYDAAINMNLEAVRLAPANMKARESLLRANAKGLKAREKDLEKKRKKYVTQAEDKYRANKAWREALEGKIAVAESHLGKKHFAEALDRYYQILEEAPAYLPALKGIETAQIELTHQLEKGGGFASDEARQVAQGFWFYNQKKWLEASQTWAPVLADSTSAKKWGSVRLGVYATHAVQYHETEERDKKINDGLALGLGQFREGNLKGAEVSFNSVLAIDPANAQAKEYAQMIPGLKKQVRADVLTEVADQQMAQTLSDAVEFYLKGYYDEAQTKVDLVLKESPTHPQALGIQEDIRKARGIPAIPSLEEKATAEQLKIEALYSDGIIAFAEGRYPDAQSAWTQVLKKAPTHSRAQQALRKLNQEQPELRGEAK